MKVKVFEDILWTKAEDLCNEFLKEKGFTKENVISITPSVKKYWCGPANVLTLVYVES